MLVAPIHGIVRGDEVGELQQITQGGVLRRCDEAGALLHGGPLRVEVDLESHPGRVVTDRGAVDDLLRGIEWPLHRNRREGHERGLRFDRVRLLGVFDTGLGIENTQQLIDETAGFLDIHHSSSFVYPPGGSTLSGSSPSGMMANSDLQWASIVWSHGNADTHLYHDPR